MEKYKRLAVLVAVVLTLALVVSTAGATSTTDPQIFVQPSGTAPAGGDPNIITDTTAFVIGVAGSFTLQDPLLVIIGVYDSTAVPSLSYAGCTDPTACPAATLTTYGLTADTATFDATSTGSAYNQLGLASGGSENFVNWSAADVGAGLAVPSGFTLYAFEIDASLVSGSPFTIDAVAPMGSFIIGYDCEVTKKGVPTGSSSGCANTGDIGQTPFTNAGFIATGPIHKAPEPASLALLGSGLVLAGGLLRRKLRTNA
jgi:hypothetical protein